MRFTEQFIQQVAQAIDIVDLVSQYVALKKRGREFIGLCPFHQDKHPSMNVSPAKQIFKCFACGAGGGVFKFVELHERLSFVEAVETLAERANIPIPREDGPAPIVQEGLSKNDLLKVMAFAARLFHEHLLSPGGSDALEYAHKRGITDEAISRFNLGYAPDFWDFVLKAARREGHSVQQLQAAGLVVDRENGDGCYDRFRNRLIFPILDVQERVIGFGGRALTPEDEPKYLNSPETPLFQKGRTLYGLNWATRAIADRRRAVIVEGYFDAIRCHLAGFEEAVATLGTALTEAHLELLRRRQTEAVYLAFDGDSAGLNAALRSREIGVAAGVRVLAVLITTGDDPDTFLQRHEPATFEEALREAKPLVELALMRLVDKYAGKPEAERLGLLKEGADLLGGLGDALEKEYYISWLAERYSGANGVNIAKVEQILLGRLGVVARAGRRAPRRVLESTVAEVLASQMQGAAPGAKLERQVLSFLLAQPNVLMEKPELISPEYFMEPQHRQLAELMLACVQAGQAPDSDRLRSQADEGLQALLAELSFAGEPWLNLVEVEKTIVRLAATRTEQRRRELSQRLAKEKDESVRQLLQRELYLLSQEISRQVGRGVIGE